MGLTNLFSDIADAIRAKTGSQATIVANDFPTAIASIPSANVNADLGWNGVDALDIPKSQALVQAGVGYIFKPILAYNSQSFDGTYNITGQMNLIEIDEIQGSNQSDAQGMFEGCANLVKAPVFRDFGGSGNYWKWSNMSNMFYGCTSLTTVPQYDAGNVATFTDMFKNCSNLSNESLNNILGMCAGAISFQGTKTLSELGINSSTDYSGVDFTAMTNYSAFISAGWSLS